MSKLFDRTMIRFLGKVVLITLLIVFTIRVFFFESFTISTDQMTPSLMKGDEVLVSKLSYGIRLPITPLSVPFTDNKYYSTSLQLPYKRIFSSTLNKGDIIVFNNPLEEEKPLDKRSLMISRCVAIPGDTILVADEKHYLGAEVDGYITRHANDSLRVEPLIFIVPSSERRVLLTENIIRIYRDVISLEMGNRAEFKDGVLYIDGEKEGIYTFKDDYYWVLSDNIVEGIDSRTLGFIPFKNIIGRVNLILYGVGDEGLRANRFFKTVN